MDGTLGIHLSDADVDEHALVVLLGNDGLAGEVEGDLRDRHKVLGRADELHRRLSASSLEEAGKDGLDGVLAGSVDDDLAAEDAVVGLDVAVDTVVVHGDNGVLAVGGENVEVGRGDADSRGDKSLIGADNLRRDTNGLAGSDDVRVERRLNTKDTYKTE